MQPTFLPWLGYFALIAQARDFVFLDDVQFSKQSWQSRNQVSGPNGPILLTVPVARKPSFPRLCDALVAGGALADTLIPRIRGALGTAPHWPLVEALLIPALARAEQGLAALNIGLIRDIADILGLYPRFHRASDLNLPPCDKAARLLAFCDRLEAVRTYLSPVGSLDYLAQGHPFTEQGTRLRFQNFTPLPYPQRWQPFRSHMSVIDALAWIGPEQTRKLILAGIGPSLTLDALANHDHSET